MPTQTKADKRVNLSKSDKLDIILNFLTYSPNQDYVFPNTVEYVNDSLSNTIICRHTGGLVILLVKISASAFHVTYFFFIW